MRRKVLLVAILIVAMLLQCIVPFMPAYAVTGVEITLNSNLYKSVKSQLEKQGIIAEYKDANGIIIIPQTELNKVTRLDLSNSEIDDLTGLSAFNKVTDLNLTANRLTVNSSLEELNSLNDLKSLNLSSNQLSSVKAISNFNNIDSVDITNQVITERLIIKVEEELEEESAEETEASEETNSAEQVTTKETDEIKTKSSKVVVTLPDILLADTNVSNICETEWFDKNFEEGSVVSYGGTCPSVDWENSFRNATTDLVLNVAKRQGSNFTALKGLVKFQIDVKDSSKLANSKMVFYFAVVGKDETGIAFNDENMYKAVKSQLTKDQTENEEITKTEEDNLYSRVYDDAYIMVVDNEIIVNDIPSLILSKKQIEDARGLDKFVGLKTNVDLSYNYLNTIQRILDLEENKSEKEKEIRIEYSKILAGLKSNLAVYDEIGLIQRTLEKYNRLESEFNDLTAQKLAKDSQLETLQESLLDAEDDEMDEIMAQIATLNHEITALSKKLFAKGQALNKAWEEYTALVGEESEVSPAEVASYKAKVNNFVKRLYNFYKREYKLTTLLPADVAYLSYVELTELNSAKSKEYANAIMEKISAIEKADGLTEYEESTIRQMMESFAAAHGFEFKTVEQKEVADPENPGITETVEEPIENAFDNFFNSIKDDKNFNNGVRQEFIFIFKCINTLSQIENYSLIKRLNEGLSDDLSEDAIEEIKEFYDEKGYDTTFIELVEKNDSLVVKRINEDNELEDSTAGVGYQVQAGYGAISVNIGLMESEYSGDLSTLADEVSLKIAHKLSAVTENDITAYVTLSKVQKLNLEDNPTRSLKGIEKLSELKELNARKNLVDNIKDISWEDFKLMRVLNLGFNQISDITPLEKIYTLTDLDVSQNLLAGELQFNLTNLRNLKEANFSYNQLTDIKKVNSCYHQKAISFDLNGDGHGDGLTVPEYLKVKGINLNFKHQTIEMTTKILNKGEIDFIEIDLLPIFEQIKALDAERTTYGVDSLNGIIEGRGKKVKLSVPAVGTQGQVKVSINGKDNYTGVEEREEYYLEGGNLVKKIVPLTDLCGMGYGTICTINYVVEGETTSEQPSNTENPGNQNKPTNPVETPEDITIEVGYTVANGYVMLYTPETTIETFKQTLVDSSEYDVTLGENKSSKFVTTGAVAVISSKTNAHPDVYLEVVVKGDIDRNGEVDALDSGYLRNIIADSYNAVGSIEAAADVNDDGVIDSLDSMLVLKYRADRISNFEK